MRKENSPRIAIIGSGFGGIGLAVALKRAGFDDFTIYERAAEIGGVWRDNTYPGAACDVPSRLYSFSFERDYDWSGRYAPQKEIWAYLKHCVAKYGLEPHIRFDTEIETATFDASRAVWRLGAADGQHVDAEVLVSAVGLFNRPLIPDIPGRETFTGTQFHSAAWDHDCALDGKTVAVIGTGASAIQFVPEIAKQAGRVHVFQKSPQYVFPRGDDGRPVDGRSRSPRDVLARRWDRLQIFFEFEKGTRRRASQVMTEAGEARFFAHLAAEVPDPELRRKLTPAYSLGCKRVLRSDDWYAMLQRPDVELIDAPVEAILPDAVRTGDGQTRAADVIVYGTGFTPTDFLSTLTVTGLDRRDLNQAWRDGAEAYLGVTVSGFPNLFMLYGPNTNVSGSIIFMLESQARYVVQCLRALRKKGARSMNVRAPTQRAFNERVQQRIGSTVLVEATCHSYFQTATGKVTTQWPGFMLEYRHRTGRVRARDYEFVAGADS